MTMDKTDSPFTFPAALKFIGKEPMSYVQKLLEEVNEVADAREEFDAIVELFDVIHVAETAIRTLAERWSVDVDDARDHCEAKNRARGYYEPEPES